MAYKCLDCGHIFEEGEQAFWSEYRGECHGRVCYEDVCGCPLCRGEFEKTTPCEICGSEHLEDELHGGACDECIDSYRHDFKNCYAISKYWKKNTNESEAVILSDIFLKLFTNDQIEEILFNHIRDHYEDVDCSKYIDEDIDWFGEMLEKLEKGVIDHENSKVES